MHASNAIRFVVLVTLALLTLRGDEARAGGLQVSPTKVDFSAKVRTGTLTLSNNGAAAVRIQAVAYAWTQSASGEIVLVATKDIVVYPSLFTLEAGKDRTVRLGTQLVAGVREKTYRVILEELPPIHDGAGGGARIRMLTRLSVPVFLLPKKATTAGKIRGLELRTGHVAFAVANTGTVHFMLGQVRLVASDASGAVVLDRSVNGWYLLTRGAWDAAFDLDASVCESVRHLEVEATAGKHTWTSKLDVSVPSCGP